MFTLCSFGQILHHDFVVVGQPGIAKTGHQRAAHIARCQLGQSIQHIAVRLDTKVAAPVVVGANALVQIACNCARLFWCRGRNLKHVHAVQDRVWYAACVVSSGDPDHLAGINGHLRKLVGETTCRVVLQQTVKRPQWVILGVAGRLVDLVHDDDWVGVLAVHQRFKHFARFGPFPLGRRT